jgi:hypothetical protein
MCNITHFSRPAWPDVRIPLRPPSISAFSPKIENSDTPRALRPCMSVRFYSGLPRSFASFAQFGIAALCVPAAAKRAAFFAEPRAFGRSCVARRLPARRRALRTPRRACAAELRPPRRETHAAAGRRERLAP